jgi:NACalpha-BTF3-like transcription factor
MCIQIHSSIKYQPSALGKVHRYLQQLHIDTLTLDNVKRVCNRMHTYDYLIKNTGARVPSLSLLLTMIDTYTGPVSVTHVEASERLGSWQTMVRVEL